MKKNRPFYKRIYVDMIDSSYQDKKKKCNEILKKEELSTSDILSLNKILFGETNVANQKFKSYSKDFIFELLEYQKKENLNNTQIAAMYKISRNTIAAWKKNFLVS